MNCATCKVNKIGPKTAPFGGFLCGNEHLQCKDCNEKSDGQCGICDDPTNFVQMNFNQRKAMMTMPPASAPALESECNLQVMETNSSYVFPKAFFADLETQSSISQEQLSMHDSQESLAIDNIVELDAQQQQAMIEQQLQHQHKAGTQFEQDVTGNQQMKIHSCPQDHIQMETLFFGNNPQQKSASNFTFKFRQQNGIMRLDQCKLVSENSVDDSSIKQIENEVEENGAFSFNEDDKDKAVVSKTIGEDIEEVIHTSEIRFMESTESMKNYYSGGTMHPIMKSKHEHQTIGSNQQETLSVKMLQDFECQNTANPSEIVENYLRSYGPLALCHFPAYSFVHNYFEGANSEHMVASEQQQQRQQQQQFQQHQQQLQHQQFQHHQQQIQKHQQQIHKHHQQLQQQQHLQQQQQFQHQQQQQQHQQHQQLAQHQLLQLQQQTQSQQQQQQQAHMRSISISTESAPSLAGVSPQKKLDLPSKYLPTDYFVMHATGVAEPAPGTLPTSDKIARPSIDMRMQKVLETFQEDPRPACEKTLLDQSKNFIKILTTEPTVTPPIPESSEHITIAAQQSLDAASTCEMPETEKTSHDMVTQLSNSHRAFYNPPTGRICSLYEHKHAHEQPDKDTTPTEPKPQYQIINCPNLIAGDILATKARYINMKPMPACQLNIPRSPIQCPESSCQRMIFVSDFNKHLIVDHSMLPMERIAPHQCKNFFLDPRLAHSGISKCHLLYLIRDKITDLGSSKFKDFLPLLVMSSRVKLSQLCGINILQHPELAEGELEFLMIWLTGIVPEEFPVWVSLTVWPRSGQVPTCHLVHSGEMYSVRRSQRVSDVCKSGQMLLLSTTEVQLLTNNGKEMLELQIVVH